MKMKKLILFLTILPSLLFISCLGMKGRQYQESSLVMINSHEGVLFAKTSNGRLITFNGIEDYALGSFWVMNYSFNEENGTVPMGQVYIDRVILSGKAVEIARKDIITAEAPHEKGMELTGLNIVSDQRLQDYFNNHWYIEFGYKAKKEEAVSINFYQRSVEGNQFAIDMRVMRTNEPTAEDVLQSKSVMLNLASIRSLFPEEENVSVIVYYYKEGKNEPEKVENRMIITR